MAFNTNKLVRFGDMVRKYVATEGDFHFIEADDVAFAVSSNSHIVCMLDTANIDAAIPEDQFDDWFANAASKIEALYDDVELRVRNGNIVFNVTPCRQFEEKSDNRQYLEDIGAFTAAILETIDGAVIDDWGDDGEEVASPYYV